MQLKGSTHRLVGEILILHTSPPRAPGAHHLLEEVRLAGCRRRCSRSARLGLVGLAEQGLYLLVHAVTNQLRKTKNDFKFKFKRCLGRCRLDRSLASLQILSESRRFAIRTCMYTDCFQGTLALLSTMTGCPKLLVGQEGWLSTRCMGLRI